LGRSSLSRGKIAYETLAMGMSGDLAYTVGIERGEMRVAGRDELSPMALRVTLIYRRENGTWKLIHRHADPITTVQAPESVIQQ
jgi:ketosteroid isomerase-like protein